MQLSTPKPASPSTRRRHVGALAAGAALATTAFVAPAGAAHSAESSACPDPYPVGSLTAGQEVTGLTVRSGTTPTEFTGTYVGTLDNGIAPGIDMPIFKMSGPTITTPGGDVDRGIWAGMSGSPVYAKDGRLVGAVSYGLSYAPSDYAGITPATAMYALRKYEKPAPQHVPVPKQIAKKLRTTGATVKESSAGMARLKMPLNVTAAGPMRRVERIAKHTGHRELTLRRAGSTAGKDAEDVPITPGGNLADSISYGDVTAASIGTATAVCGKEVIAFGHPDALSGKTSTTMHGADAVYIEKDFDGSFKVANLGTPQGRISQDRMAGILGKLGKPPRSTKVTVSTKAPYNSYTGTSYNSLADYLSLTVGTQVMNDADVAYDRIGAGTATMTWTMHLERRNGKTITYKRHNTYADQNDLTGTMPFEVAADVDTLLGNRFAHVRIGSVTVHSDIHKKYEAYRISRLDYRTHGHWTKATGSSVVTRGAGKRLAVRVTLTPKRHSTGKVRRFVENIKIPRHGTRGKSGTLRVRGHLVPYWRYGTGMRGADSLPQLVHRMQSTAHNDTVSVQLAIGTGKHAAKRSQRHTAPSTVSGARSLSVTVAK